MNTQQLVICQVLRYKLDTMMDMVYHLHRELQDLPEPKTRKQLQEIKYLENAHANLDDANTNLYNAADELKRWGIADYAKEDKLFVEVEEEINKQLEKIY